MTITEMIAKLIVRLNLPASNDFFTTAELTGYLNDGYRNFVSETRCLRKFVLIDVVADQQEYDLPSDNLQPLWFGYDDESLFPMSSGDMDRIDEEWVDQNSGTPGYVAVALGGIEKFQLYYPPCTASSLLSASTTEITDFEDWADNVLLYYEYEIETDLTSGQTPDLETPFQWALIYYALAESFRKEGDIKDFTQASFWELRYRDKISQKKKQLVTGVDDLLIMGGLPSPGEILLDPLDVNRAIEWMLEDYDELIIEDDGVIYYGSQMVSGGWPEGTWKKTRVEESTGSLGNDLILYRYESSIWVEKGRWTA